MFEPSLEVAGGGFDDAGRGVPGIEESVETVAGQVVDQGELARPRWADVDVVAFGIFGGQPIELVEDLADVAVSYWPLRRIMCDLPSSDFSEGIRTPSSY